MTHYLVKYRVRGKEEVIKDCGAEFIDAMNFQRDVLSKYGKRKLDYAVYEQRESEE